MDLKNITDYKSRGNALGEECKTKLSNVVASLIDPPTSVTCENLIGAVTIPLGVAGPLKITNMSGATCHVYIPLATTEGALIASVNRGARAITESDGALVKIEKVGITRGPVFEVANLKEGTELETFIKSHLSELQKIAAETSKHLSLLSIWTQLVGNYLYLRISYDTDQAMGMNMATIATEEVVSFISSKTEARCIALAGNFDVDKKPSWMNMIMGRGRRGWAEVLLTEEVLKNILKTDAASLVKVVYAKCWGGSMISGTMAYNAHFANIAAAFFVATGQDPGHVVEGSLGVTTATILEEGVRFGVYLPDIILGMVGGGCGLITQSEARSITQAKTVDQLAEVFVAAVLAGELSLLSALASGTLAKAHKTLGRKQQNVK